MQSSYRKNHKTKTALLKVKNNILLNMNKHHNLLDLSAAFDTVDHDILLKRLSSKLGLRYTLHSSLVSFLPVSKFVCGSLAEKFHLCYGVSLGSCLGQLLFMVYAGSLFHILQNHLPTVHCYADDTVSWMCLSVLMNALVRQRLLVQLKLKWFKIGWMKVNNYY